jgi:hypothetical protein
MSGGNANNVKSIFKIAAIAASLMISTPVLAESIAANEIAAAFAGATYAASGCKQFKVNQDAFVVWAAGSGLEQNDLSNPEITNFVILMTLALKAKQPSCEQLWSQYGSSGSVRHDLLVKR